MDFHHILLLLLIFLVDLADSKVLADNTNANYVINNNAIGYKKNASKCNIYEGRWIYDILSSPYYETSTCPFIGLDCQKFGRPDKDYLYYQWQPTGCDIPSFSGLYFLKRFRGKKILFVGDSLSNNMWVSLCCMLYASVPNATYSFKLNKKLSTFTIPEYGISVNYLKNGFLVDLVADKTRGLVLKLDSISTGKQWLGSDVVIFNTFHWWTHTGRSKTWDYFQVGDRIEKEMDRMEAFKIALKTWANWVDHNIDPSKARVFYQGVSPVHLNGSEWGKPGKTCLGETKPVKGTIYPRHSGGEAIVSRVIRGMAKPVSLLDVTAMTEMRKDGHPSIYAGGGRRLNDCSHWCLPGVPDAWNQLLYVALLVDV
ncbi:unnamed protein product [Arabis nemorensis]|uniref:Uncharacterized protein n=1 Tax=Arabis nemorensis TaxID=586526 RepID=A0A565B287_9BRAS|nr:unnamed protein product [Arabis nemorensis]